MFDFTPDQERKLLADLEAADSRMRAAQARATPQLAQQVGQLYRDHPYAPPGLIMSTANAMQSGMMNADAANNLIVSASKNALEASVMTPKEDKKKSWWERNVSEKVRTASRWTMAGLNFVPQVATNVASQLFKEGGPSTKGFFISTDLGTLIANDEEAGSGWFMGGKAFEKQAERARKYRGEIGGHAWTFGRGAASVISQPGSKTYNILSGIVDAGAALYIPSVPGAGVAKGVAATGLGKAGLRTLSGLTDFESAIIQTDKVAGFLQSRGGQSIIKRMVDIKTIDEALDVFKDVQHMDFINEVVRIKSQVDMHNYLLKTLGRPIRDDLGNVGKGVATIDQINLSRIGDVKRYVAGKSSFVAKMFSSVPGNHIVLAGGNPRDVAQSVRNVNNYLKILKVDPKRADEVVTAFSKALVANDGTMYAALDEFYDVMTVALQKTGAPDGMIMSLQDSLKAFAKEKDVYGAIGKTGEPTAYGAKVILQDGSLAQAPFATAGLQSEMLSQLSMTLPDPRKVRRMTSQIGWIFGKGGKVDPSKYRDLRLPFSALEAFQNEIWRPITLMTGGYVLRNMTDSAFRYTMTPGLKGGALHPIQWIQIASRKRFRGTLKGQTWDNLTDDVAERLAREGMEEFNAAVGQTIRENLSAPAIYEQGRKNRHWGKADRFSGSLYRKGIQDEISELHDDFAARLFAQQYTTDEIVDQLKNNEDYVRKLQARWSNREMELADGSGTKVIGTPDLIDPATGRLSANAEENLRYYVEEYIAKRVEDVTGNDNLLMQAVAEGKIDDGAGNLISIFRESGGKRVAYSGDWDSAVQRVIDDNAARIARGENSILKDVYKYGVDVNQFDPNVQGRELSNWLKSWGKATDSFFSSLYPKRSGYLMQSPVFRQYYWKETAKLMDELNTASLVSVRDNLKLLRINEYRKAQGLPAVQRKGGKLGVNKVGKNGKTTFTQLTSKELADLPVLTDTWLAKYVGDGKVGKRLYDRLQNTTSSGKLSLDELDAYAKGSALDQTKNLFYNATEKSNFADILRIAVPFGSAWAEVMNTWGKIAVSNPQAVRRVGVSVQGLQNADPDGDGKGFFWRDPVSGDWVFNYPFSDKIGGLAAGLTPIGAAIGGVAGGLPGIAIGAAAGAGIGFATQEGLGLEQTRLTAPVKSLSMGLNIYPGLGPFAQISASKILNKYPDADFIRSAILPYGEPDISTIGPIPVPSWGRKVIEAVRGNPDNNRLLGDLTIEVMRVLNLSGEYDLSTPEGRDKLENDSIIRARTLLLFRGIGQLAGPVRPDIEFKIPTDQGDMYTVELSKAFRDMQAENYDTAVEKFISTFGDDAFLYIQGKTRAEKGGLDASSRFGQFERDNGELFSKHSDVAGYFANVGTNFDFAVYSRQIESGQREKLKPSEFLELAQETIGRAMYRSAQRAVGPNPDTIQKDALRSVKSLLQNRYPGYATAVVDINATKARILKIRDAAFDPILADNPIAKATRAYFEFRDQAQTELENRGIDSKDLTVKKAADLRAYLRNVADILIRRYPEFERLFDRVFYNEIEAI